ncbi:hypothetical protein OsJ_23790 [Oryza sativa Japonica Group]|uniref:Uncharacterized protein n=1 Tax=Oryza sativa subsp. japonica TaxID=39947 RepID=B9FWJ4_ORYSJ|nr:hypothetical protein OsJ_23790 [Oryza sativa Japonica Group]
MAHVVKLGIEGLPAHAVEADAVKQFLNKIGCQLIEWFEPWREPEVEDTDMFEALVSEAHPAPPTEKKCLTFDLRLHILEVVDPVEGKGWFPRMKTTLGHPAAVLITPSLDGSTEPTQDCRSEVPVLSLAAAFICAVAVARCFMPMSSLSGTVSVPHCPVIFDGINYNHWAQHMHLNMRGQCLWDVLSGELACPPFPLARAVPTFSAQTTDEDRAKAQEEYDDVMETYQGQYAMYKTWLDEDARASVILVTSMEVHLTGDVVTLASAHLMWTHLRDRHAPTGDALYLAMCCQRQRSHIDLCRIYDFLTRLRSEYESIRAQLLARHPRVTLMEALTEIRYEEICLREAGSAGSIALPSAQSGSVVPGSQSSNEGSSFASAVAYIVIYSKIDVIDSVTFMIL